MNEYIFVVIDETGNPIFAAKWKRACHEHINDAIDMGIEFAGEWRVRRFVADPESGDETN